MKGMIGGADIFAQKVASAPLISLVLEPSASDLCFSSTSKHDSEPRPPLVLQKAMLVATCRRLPYITLPNRRSTSSLPLVHIPPCSIHALGAPPSSPPLFTSFAWTIHPSHAWCVLGSGTTSKSTLLSLLAGAHRLHPPPPPPHGRFPRWSAAGADPFREVAEVSFAHRARGAGAGFLDYSARYGAVREEDRITLRERLFKEGGGGMDGRKKEVLERLGLRELLDLPYVALSNGQTRRARVARALISAPGMLVLDEPLSRCCSVLTRTTIAEMMHSWSGRGDARNPS